MILKEAGITILCSKEKVTIEIEDNNASIKFVRVTMTPEQFTQALSRLSNTQCSVEVEGLDRVGKKMEVQRLEFEIDPDFRWKGDKGLLNELADQHCPEGWIANHYFNSRNSFIDRNKKVFAVTTIRRWVDIGEE